MTFDRYRKYTSFENIIVLLFIFVLMVVLLDYYKKYEYVVKKRVSYEQLYQINTAIVIYMAVNGKLPKDLKELVSKNFVEKRENYLIKKKYIEGLAIDDEGFPVDGWGRRFKYDNIRGVAYLADSDDRE